MRCNCAENIGVYIVIGLSITIIVADTIELVNDFEQWNEF